MGRFSRTVAFEVTFCAGVDLGFGLSKLVKDCLVCDGLEMGFLIVAL